MESLAGGVLRRREADYITISQKIEKRRQLLCSRVSVRAGRRSARFGDYAIEVFIAQNRVQHSFRCESAPEADHKRKWISEAVDCRFDDCAFDLSFSCAIAVGHQR